MPFLFGCVSLLSAALMFSVEPMVGKLMLPAYGGTPTVWNTCLFFFQAMLLCGYLYAHGMRRLLSRWPLLQVLPAAVAMLVLPVALPGWAGRSSSSPGLHVLVALVVMVGAPFLALSTLAPLIQWWFSQLGHRRSADPYFLYAAGNAGSFVGLVAYPVLIESHLTLSGQARLWEWGYGLLVALLAVAAAVTRRRLLIPATTASSAEPAPPVSWRRRVRWLALAFLPSSLLLGTTTYLSTDVAAVPLLWVLPLGVYLLTFVLVFSRRGPLWTRVGTLALPGLTLGYLAATFHLGLRTAAGIALMCLLLGAVGLAAHGRLAADRPTTARLTEFYVLLSLGGALGGAFNSLLAPVLFDRVIELPLGLAALMTFLAVDGSTGINAVRVIRQQPARALASMTPGIAPIVVMGGLSAWTVDATAAVAVVTAAVVLVGLVVALVRGAVPSVYAATAILLVPAIAISAPAILHKRTFFGIYMVGASNGEHLLVSGATLHGSQSTDPSRAGEPQTYYTREGPVGDIFRASATGKLGQRVAVVGLGAGSLAAYGRSGQHMTFYELDPAVVHIAENPRYFTFMANSRATTNVIVGDGRLMIRRAPSAAYGIIVLDAFSSDAVPVHLMTRDAVRLYLSKLQPNGLIVFHVSNKHLRLDRVVAGVARAEGLATLARSDYVTDRSEYRVPSEWVALARSRADLRQLADLPGWRPLTRSVRAWTDDYSNLLSVWK